MTTDILLSQLRARLACVQRLIEDAALVNPLRHSYLYAAGRLIELRGERAFLTDLIAQIEREEVQP